MGMGARKAVVITCSILVTAVLAGIAGFFMAKVMGASALWVILPLSFLAGSGSFAIPYFLMED